MEYQPKLMKIVLRIITSAWNGVGQFLELLNAVGSGPLSRACLFESEDDNPIIALSELSYAIGAHFESAVLAILPLAELLLCRSFNPLYTSLTYNIVCTDFVNMGTSKVCVLFWDVSFSFFTYLNAYFCPSVAPMLWCLFIISISSMVMVTLRVAWHEFVPEDDDVDDIVSGNHQSEVGAERDDTNAKEDDGDDVDSENASNNAAAPMPDALDGESEAKDDGVHVDEKGSDRDADQDEENLLVANAPSEVKNNVVTEGDERNANPKKDENEGDDAATLVVDAPDRENESSAKATNVFTDQGACFCTNAVEDLLS